METNKPGWWPNNPYPESVFPMRRSEYQNIVPDPKIRTALSGMLGREFWDIASDAIWAAMEENPDPQDEIDNLLTAHDVLKSYADWSKSEIERLKADLGNARCALDIHADVSEELARLREVEKKAIERYNALYEAARQYLNTGFTSARHKLREIVAVSR